MTISIDEIRDAARTLRPSIHRTPLVRSQSLSALAGTPLHLKAESLQRTGSFKARGVLNAVLALSPEERARGIFTFSAGNTGLALAYAGRTLGIPATVMVPETAPRAKIDAIDAYGARIVAVPGAELMQRAAALPAEEGLTVIHPWENRALIAGHGTIGLEILEDLPDVATVVVPVGGGGLIAGIASALKAIRPEVRVVGVEPEGSQSVGQSLAAGEPVHITPVSIADGLNAPSTAPTPLAIIAHLVDEIVTVPEESIASALALIIQRTKLLSEPSGAVATAALLSGAVQPAGPTVAILSGANVDLHRLSGLVGASG
ncbi:MAG TPA: threonine/serine dehydratase [Chloroflexota bacterium]|nr:threonine/serine dehydratase [Chloroflexota bacterium]